MQVSFKPMNTCNNEHKTEIHLFKRNVQILSERMSLNCRFLSLSLLHFLRFIRHRIRVALK